ncbi:hypothetical protein AB0K27_28405 [Micromonospora echinospora]|uniref:Uncharacterized protein n=1 Tax=Micromonospora echinospora TaxID=1877 RepID=A0ABR6MFL8_MICEC|nr:hypothetical protein [Micromonospora echinospora]MBB5114181.1 hypothetical protein [Micromonospora echinospora]
MIDEEGLPGSGNRGGVSDTDHLSCRAVPRDQRAADRRPEAAVAPMAGDPGPVRMTREAASDTRPWNAVEWVA